MDLDLEAPTRTGKVGVGVAGINTSSSHHRRRRNTSSVSHRRIPIHSTPTQLKRSDCPHRPMDTTGTLKDRDLEEEESKEEEGEDSCNNGVIVNNKVRSQLRIRNPGGLAEGRWMELILVCWKWMKAVILSLTKRGIFRWCALTVVR